MSTLHGSFLWHDAMTTDPRAAESFYRSVMGWQARDAGVPGRSYTVLSVGETGIGGLMPMPPDAGPQAQPLWMGYIGVDDVDVAAQRVTALGGALHRAPDDIPGVGRFAVTADPQGNVFVLFRGMTPSRPEPVAPGIAGHVGWNELRTADREAAFAFYAELFGWTKAEAVDLGPAGLYQMFAVGGATAGAMMTRPEGMPGPGWLFYFNVEAADAAAQRVTAAGGRVLHGPMQVPGGSWIAQCVDPQGAMFAVVSPQR